MNIQRYIDNDIEFKLNCFLVFIWLHTMIFASMYFCIFDLCWRVIDNILNTMVHILTQVNKLSSKNT